MSHQEEFLNRINERLNQLALKQVYLNSEIDILQQELKNHKSGNTASTSALITESPRLETIPNDPLREAQPKPLVPITPQGNMVVLSYQTPLPKREAEDKNDWEKFLGENLVNKIGIAITVIGVGIGAKYAIDHNLISPLMRILMGYLFAGALLGVAIKLKKNYLNYSAVLLSGALAIMYFLTYLAYGHYSLIQQVPAFVMMVVFTAFTVFSALKYNEVVIAIIGLVGAYAIPYLLSDGSGNVLILFTYMFIINVGILFIAFKRNWLPLLYAAFILTWLIVIGWFVNSFDVDKHFVLTLVFTSLFFLLFYIAFLANRIVAKQIFGIPQTALLLANTFIQFGIGYATLNAFPGADKFLGLFTVITAAVHFSISVYIYRKDLADKQLYYLVSGLVLVFITLAVPVQLKGNWITVMWAAEALLLFWIGRSRKSPVYELLSLPVFILAGVSLFVDWAQMPSIRYMVETKQQFTPFFTIDFLTGSMVVVAIAGIYKVNKNFPESNFGNELSKLAGFIQVIFLSLLYLLFYMEIARWFDLSYYASSVIVSYSDEGIEKSVEHINFINQFKVLGLLLYTLIFLGVITGLYRKFNGPNAKSTAIFILNGLATLVFLFAGLYVLSELREGTLHNEPNGQPGSDWGILIRYPALAVLSGFLWINLWFAKKSQLGRESNEFIQLALHTVIVWVLSSELLHWLDIAGITNTYKLGLSLLWGSYSLGLIALGIWKNRRFIRLAAFVLFGITLLKLFTYDITRLSTISKTIAFVGLGILLLIISFLYNKYKHLIINEKA